MTKPSDGPTTGQLLQQYIANHEKNVQSFAKAVGVGTASVYRWFGKHGPRSNVVRVVVEMRTGGRIKAEMWPTPGSRWAGVAMKQAKKKIAKKSAKKRVKKIVKTNSKKKNSKKSAKKPMPVEIRKIIAGIDAQMPVSPNQMKAKTPPTPPSAAT